MKTKEFLRICSFLIFVSFSFFAIAQQNPVNSNPVAYYIHIPGKLTANGYYSPERLIPVEQLSKENYLPNTIYLKLKISAKDKLLPANRLQSDPLIISLNKINAGAISNLIHEVKIPLEKDEFGIGRIYEISYTADRDPYDVCRELILNPDVEYAVPVFKRYTCAFTPNDQQFANQWALAKVKAADAWDISKGDPSVVIAIVDVGTEWTHTDLSANIWTNPNEVAGNGIDDDSNGKVDDIHGWDFVGNANIIDIQNSNWKEDNNPTTAIDGHGTHTAGIAAAATNNGIGIAGMGFNCKILPIKCGSDVTGVSGIYRGYTAILYAAQMGAKIISCSWGGPGYNPAEEDIIHQVTAMGSLVIAASGNNGQNVDLTPFYPGAFPEVLNVGSTASDDKIVASSNYGSKVSVFAPGDNIFSTYLANTYNSLSGTSMACPLVAGLAGLVKTIHPGWEPAQIKQQIRISCDNILGSTDQNQRYLYWGRINALKALQYNNSMFPAYSTPGMNAYNIEISGTDALKDYNPVNIRLSLKNYLSKADSIKVNIKPLSDFVSVTKNDFYLYNLKSLDTASLFLAIKLLDNNPWFKGKAELLITYSTNGYTDIQKIEIPINISSDNIFSTKGAVNSAAYIQWYGVSPPEKTICWGAGYSQTYGAIYFNCSQMGFVSNTIKIGTTTVADPVYCIHGFDASVAIVGTGKGYLLRTINGGSSWSKITISTITDFVNALLFKGQDTGIILGDPKSNTWGIGITTDKGLTWNVLNNVPAPLSGETGIVETVYQEDEKVWFGTTKGRVFYTADFGKNWQVSTLFSGGYVIRLAFSDSLHGIASYTESGGTGQILYLANTSDGGITWNKRIADLTQNGLYSLSFSHLPGTNKILAVYTNGYAMITSDLGLTWHPVLSQQSVSYEAVKPSIKDKNVRIWEAGDYINSLDFVYSLDSSTNHINPLRKNDLSLQIYPVPSNEYININTVLPKGEYTEIELLDFSGKTVSKVYNGVSAGGYCVFRIPAHNLSSGTYFIRLKTRQLIKTVPVIIAR